MEDEGVRECHAYLNPNVKHITRNTCTGNVLKLYQKGKSKVMDLLSSSLDGIFLTSDFLSCMTFDSYVCITTHFIDKIGSFATLSLLYLFSSSS